MRAISGCRSRVAKKIPPFRGLTTALFAALALSSAATPIAAQELDSAPFGDEYTFLDTKATGRWWEKRGRPRDLNLNVPRDEVLAFAVYTVADGTLKLTAQAFPLKPEESRSVELQLMKGDQWSGVDTQQLIYPGWSAHFRIDGWDDTQTVKYRLTHEGGSSLEGTVRANPRDKDEIVVGVLSCNSSRTSGPRESIVNNLKHPDPDLLFFAGDQSYHHKEHTYGWLEFGMQFRDVLLDRPVIAIPDDHDVGQANLWGEGGKWAETEAGNTGGFVYPAEYVNMVQRCQTWHLPDPVDPTPIDRGIGVYYTRYNLGGIDFAIVEDRKWKSGPAGKIPQMGPRPDHINDPAYDRAAIDLPGLELLGARQLEFLERWGDDWTGARMKCVLSQTAFCGAVHLHGTPDNRLLADLDCNGWPQSERDAALRLIRKAWATHLCGDQHLATMVKHGIDADHDGPYAFTTPAIVNTIYGRWWHPVDEAAGENPVDGSPLPWTGNYEDGLGNPIRMLAYANPGDIQDERQRGDGHGLVRFRKSDRSVTVECWPRFADVTAADAQQYPGWPVRFSTEENDGRAAVGSLPRLDFEDADDAVVQVIDQASGEELYTVRTRGKQFAPPVYAQGTYTVRVGADRPNIVELKDLRVVEPGSEEVRRVRLGGGN